MDANRKKWLMWGGIALVLLLVVGGVFWWQYANREEGQEIAPGQTLYNAGAGQVVRKFPAELILENGPQILKSYRIEYSDDNTSQPFVRYVSAKSFAENVDMFTKYFRDNEWEMLRWGDANEKPATFFEGAKNNNEVNVLLNEESGKVEVSIAYTLNP